jgi:hypothetical protein
MKQAITITLLLAAISSGQLMDKPELEWAVAYPNFSEILEVDEGNGGFICGCSDALRFMDDTGSVQWSIGPTDVGWYYLKNQAVLHVEGEGYVSTGVGKVTAGSSYSIFFMKIDYSGNPLWIKNYDDPETTDYAFDVISLPDSGFAVAARRGWDTWVLRTDSQGDTLWTRQWGAEGSNRAVGLLNTNSELTVLMRGSTSSTPGGPHLVRYDLNGNLLWECNIPLLEGENAQAICKASDGGFLILTNDYPLIVHTDSVGSVQWSHGPHSTGYEPRAWSVNSTMDGGFVVGVGAEDSYGVISRHSLDLGIIEWWDVVYDYICTDVYSVRQLSQGGYIAAGKANPNPSPNPPQAILLRYAPETGIAEPDTEFAFSLEVSPTPCNTLMSISFSQPEIGYISVQVFDLSGRLISTVAEGCFPAGSSSVEWTVPEELTSGCHFIRCVNGSESITQNFVLLR